MKFWLTYLFRYFFRRDQFVPVHMAGTQRKRWAAIKRSEGRIHTHSAGWSYGMAVDYCDELNRTELAVSRSQPDPS